MTTTPQRTALTKRAAPLVLNEGWWPALSAILIAIGAAVVATAAANDLAPVVARVEAAAVIVLLAGVAIGGERLSAGAALPALAGVVIGAGGDDGIAWASSVLVGCGWYVAVELALASIERRGALSITPTVAAQRRREVATVVAVSAAVCLLAAALATVGPERSLIVRIIGIVAVLAALFGALRHLAPVSRTER